MYTVPVKFPIRAKKLIESFEKGEILREPDQADEPDSSHREKYANEQAMPGTTKKRLLELERKKLEMETETRSERHSSTTGKLSEEMFGDFASDRLKRGEGTQHYGSSRNGSTDEVQVSDGVEVFLEEHHEDPRVETPEGGGKHEVESKSDAVLVVSYAGQSPSFVDSTLIKVLENTIQESGRKILTTYLHHSDAHAISYAEERQKLSEADLVVLHFRSVFRTLPAKLMEWLENVLVEKFAYDEENGKTFDNGLLKNGVLRFVGMSVLTPHLIYGAQKDNSSDEDEEVTRTLRKRLDGIWHETPLF